MKKLTKRHVVNEYLLKANGDPLKALRMAVEDQGRIGYGLSSGYVRAAPYTNCRPLTLLDNAVDIDAPDGDDE